MTKTLFARLPNTELGIGVEEIASVDDYDVVRLGVVSASPWYSSLRC